MFRITALALGILALFYSINVKLGGKAKEVSNVDEELVPKKKLKKREPASIKKVAQTPKRNTPTYQPQVIPRDDSPRRDEPIIDDYADSSSVGSAPQQTYSMGNSYSYGGGGGGSGYSSGRSYSGDSSGLRGSGSSSSSSGSSGSSLGGTQYFSGVPYSGTVSSGGTTGSSSGGGSNNNDDDDDDNDSGNSSGGSNTASLTCSSNQGGGAYQNPITVGLTCSSPSTIKYCLSQGACCDPRVSGTVYSSNLIIGELSGDYCLSFYGESSTLGKSSTVTQLNYDINNILPDIQVTHKQTFFQTTQLSGRSEIRSNDSGKQNFVMGQISLKSNDPGPSGLNMSCGEIVTNYVELPQSPVATMSPFDMLGLTVTQQAVTSIDVDDLVYGDNFITSYVIDKNYATPLYSCSTTKINLWDFEYFQAGVAHASPVTGNYREFAGEFTVYGFFESDEETVYQAQSGSSSEEIDGRSLKSGMFSIFF